MDTVSGIAPAEFARDWAQRQPLWMDRDAFTGEALFAVAAAARKYEPRPDYVFCSVASRWVKYALLRETRRQHQAVCLPLEALESSGGFIPDPAEGPEQQAVRAVSWAEVERAIQRLPPRCRDVLRRRYWDEKTLQAIGDADGITFSQVSALERKALKQLRQALGLAEQRMKRA
jgi:RNA polymerase sigma factor (sigma-70 family)